VAGDCLAASWIAVAAQAVFLGELGLGGEVRAVTQVERRLAEAAKLGMTEAYLSERAVPHRVPAGMTVHGVRTLADVLQRSALGNSAPKRVPAAAGAARGGRRETPTDDDSFDEFADDR
jgi:hypothetical protein